MRYNIILFLAFNAIVLSTRAQEPGIMAVGFSCGAMNYKGDLDDEDVLKFTKFGLGINAIVLPNAKFNFGFSYLHGKIGADDAKATNTGNKYRNLNFYSAIDEFSLFAIYRFRSQFSNFSSRKTIIPYLFGGISFFHFNPKTRFNGVVYELQKMGTEGQFLTNDPANGLTYPEPYSLWQVSIPFGAGVKYKISETFDIGLEMGLHPTFTDYLDDVSTLYPDKDKLLQEKGEVVYALSDRSNDPKRPQGRSSFSRRGDAGDNDWFIYTNVNVTYYFTTYLFKGLPRF